VKGLRKPLCHQPVSVFSHEVSRKAQRFLPRVFRLFSSSQFLRIHLLAVAFVLCMLLSPAAPNFVSSVDCSVFSAFKQITPWVTIFYFTQCRHYLSVSLNKISDNLTFQRELLKVFEYYKVFQWSFFFGTRFQSTKRKC